MSSKNEKPRKVLLLQETYLPLVGGAELHVFYLAKELLKRGFSVEIITGSEKGPDENGEICPVHRFKLSSSRRKNIFAFPLWFIRVLRLAASSDIVHAHYTSFVAFTAALAAKALGKRMIVTLHGLGTLDSSVNRSWLFKMYRAVSMKWADQVIATSDEMRQVALRFVPDSKIQLIENGVDVEKFSAPLPRDFGSLRECMRMGTVRRLVPKNGVQFLVDALGRAGGRLEYQLRIWGWGRLKESVEERILKYGLSGKISIGGTLNHDQLVRELSNVDMTLFMSTAESTSLAALESMSMGCLVVCSNAGAFPEFIKDGETGFIVDLFQRGHSDYLAPEKLEDWQYQAILDKLAAIQSMSPERLKRISENARGYVKAKYDWSVIVGRILETCYGFPQRPLPQSVGLTSVGALVPG